MPAKNKVDRSVHPLEKFTKPELKKIISILKKDFTEHFKGYSKWDKETLIKKIDEKYTTNGNAIISNTPVSMDEIFTKRTQSEEKKKATKERAAEKRKEKKAAKNANTSEMAQTTETPVIPAQHLSEENTTLIETQTISREIAEKIDESEMIQRKLKRKLKDEEEIKELNKLQELLNQMSTRMNTLEDNIVKMESENKKIEPMVKSKSEPKSKPKSEPKLEPKLEPKKSVSEKEEPESDLEYENEDEEQGSEAKLKNMVKSVGTSDFPEFLEKYSSTIQNFIRNINIQAKNNKTLFEDEMFERILDSVALDEIIYKYGPEEGVKKIRTSIRDIIKSIIGQKKYDELYREGSGITFEITNAFGRGINDRLKDVIQKEYLKPPKPFFIDDEAIKSFNKEIDKALKLKKLEKGEETEPYYELEKLLNHTKKGEWDKKNDGKVKQLGNDIQNAMDHIFKLLPEKMKKKILKDIQNPVVEQPKVFKSFVKPMIYDMKKANEIYSVMKQILKMDKIDVKDAKILLDEINENAKLINNGYDAFEDEYGRIKATGIKSKINEKYNLSKKKLQKIIENS